MHKMIFSFAMLAITLASCGTAETKKVEETNKVTDTKNNTVSGTTNNTKAVAADVCGCLEPAFNGLSDKAKSIVVKTFSAKAGPSSLPGELIAIEDETERQKVTQEIIVMGHAVRDGQLQACLNRVDLNHASYKFKETSKSKEFIDELSRQCPLAAAVFQKGMEVQKIRAKP